MYVIKTSGRKGFSLFLVDRRKNKMTWWVKTLSIAMIFENQQAAQNQANKLAYKNPTVITLEKAKRLVESNIILEDELERNYPYDREEHPFSSDALGQW